jgi:two-component system, response regulator / RNA-binding antiterminator
MLGSGACEGTTREPPNAIRIECLASVSLTSSEAPDPLRVLIANERQERLKMTTGLVAAMGHHVIARSLEVSEVAAATAEAMPDVALVGVGESSEHALELISQIVREAACPVIAILETKDAELVNEAAKRGIFAYVTDSDPEELQGAVDIVLRRFAEFHRLEGALGRRALTERAKGILMERSVSTNVRRSSCSAPTPGARAAS